MEAAFGWIQQLWEFLVSLIPHLELLPADQRAVKFKGGGRTKVIEPGRYWYIPILTEVREMKVNRQTSNLSTVVLTTKDEVDVALSPVIVYSIKDIEKALVATDDIDDAIGDVGMKAFVQAVAQRTYKELKEAVGDGELEAELTKETRKLLRKYGVDVESTFTSEFASSFYRVIGDGHTGVVLPTEHA